MEASETVIERARRAAGLTQAQMAYWSGTQQSSVSEYEARKKAPTLEVVERLLAAADAELTFKPIINFEEHDDPEIGTFWVPERLWTVPIPACFSKVQVAGFLFKSSRTRVWDLSVEAERIDFYTWAILHGTAELLLDAVDGVLLVQVWDRLEIPEAIRRAWQPILAAAISSQDTSPRDPGGFSAWITKEVGVTWRPIRKRKPRPPQKPIPRISLDSPVSIVRRAWASGR